MLSRGNTKLGDIYNFNLPAVITCPGASKECLSECYATKGRYVFSRIQKRYLKNLVLSFRDDFPDMIVGLLNSKLLDKENIIVRLHGSGDFYSVDYINKWIDIVNRCPDITFYGYTRSWRIDKLREKLEVLASIDNVNLYASTDASTPEAERLLKDWQLEASFLIEPYVTNDYKECWKKDKCINCGNCLCGKKSVRFMEKL